MDLRPARKLVHEGVVKAIAKTSDLRARYLYLLSDMLLVGKPRGENSYKLKAQLFLADSWINPNPSGSHSVRKVVTIAVFCHVDRVLACSRTWPFK